MIGLYPLMLRFGQSNHQSAMHVLYVTFRRGTKIWLDCWMSVVMLRGATFVDAIEVETRLLSADPDPKNFPSVIITQGLCAMLFATGRIRLELIEP
jgi:hypothetical protein